MAGFTKNFVKRELTITLKSHNNNLSSVVFTLLRCVYGCLWPVACVCVFVHILYILRPSSKNLGELMGPIGSVRIARGVGVEPLTSPCRPPTSGQNSTPGVEFQPPPKFC